MVTIPGRPTPRNARTPSARNQLRAASVNWGGISFRAFMVPLSLSQGVLPRLSTSGEASREGRQGVIPWVLDDLSGGFLRPGEAGSRYNDWGRDKNRVYRNEGIICHVPGITSLAYALTTQTAVVALDVSGYRAGNRRVHSRMFNGRFVAGIGPQIVKDTSTTDPTLAVPTTDNVADDVLSMWVGYFNNTRYLVIGTDGQASDVRGTTDPYASSITWVSLITYGDAADAIWAGDYFPDLGGGYNVLIGALNGVNGVWSFPRDVSVPVTSPTAVAVAGTLSETNPDAVEETLTVSALTTAMLFENSSPGAEGWSGHASAIGSDGTKALNSFAAGAITHYLGIVLAGAISEEDLPDDVEVTGLSITVEAAESNADDNVYFYDLGFWIDPFVANSDVGPDVQIYASPTATSAASRPLGVIHGELSTTDASYTLEYTDIELADITAAQVRGGAIGFNFSDTTGTSPRADVDDISAVTIKFKRKGQQMNGGAGSSASGAAGPGFQQGGFSCGKLLANPRRLPYVEPEIDDLTGVTQRRRLRFLDLGYDTSSQLVTGSTSTPATGLAYIGVICEYQGGVAVAGGRSATLWNQVKIVDADNQTRDLGMPPVHGTKPQTIVSMVSQGSSLLVRVADTDATDSQLWIYHDGRWNALGVLQSKSSAITREPLLWAETTLGDQNGYAYNFLSLSTNLAGSREFVPSDLLADPHLTNTSVVKHNGPLYVQGVELDVGGAVEAQKSLMVVRSLSRRLDDDTLYGDVRMLVNTTGDPAFGANQVDKTFNAAFEEHNIVTGNDPGIALQTAIVRLIHDHGAGTAKSPQALPIEWDLVGGWEPQEVMRFYLGPFRDPEGQSQPLNANILHLHNRIKTLQATKRVQRLNGAGFDDPAEIIDFQITYKPDTGKTPPSEDDVESAYIDVRIAPGATS